MVVVIDLEEEEAKKAAAAAAAAAAKQEPVQNSSDGSNPKQSQAEAGNGKTDKSHGDNADSSVPKDQPSKGIEGGAQAAALDSDVSSKVKDSKDSPKSKMESSKVHQESSEGKPVGEGTQPKVQSSSKSKLPSEASDKEKGGKSKVSSSEHSADNKKKEDMTSERKTKKENSTKLTPSKDPSKSKKEIKTTKVETDDKSTSPKLQVSAKDSTKSKLKENPSESKKTETTSTKMPTPGIDSSSELNKDVTNPVRKQTEPGSKSSDKKSNGKNNSQQELKSETTSESDTVQKAMSSSGNMDSSTQDKSKSELTAVEIKEQKEPQQKDVQSRPAKRPQTYTSFASSLRDPTLQSWVKTVREQLKQTKQEDSVLALFSKCKTDEERISVLYSLPVVHEVLPVKECYKGKNDEAAKSLRVQGNTAFQKKEYDAALKHYSESILKAPSSGSSELALALANRSAVLYHQHQYVLCLQDIRQAFKHKYPDHLQYKLYERRGKACFCLKLKEDANCAFQDAINVLDKAQLDETKLATVKADLTKQLQKCNKLVSVDNIKSARDFNHNHGPLPLIKDSHSQHIPCMSNSLVLKYSSTDGRGLYATRDIEVGEVLIIEKPYASVTLADYNLTHCHHCCNRVFCPLPCYQCSGVIFCSEECQQTAWESYHSVECKYHDLIQRSELGMGHLALRMVLKAGLEYLKEYRQRADGEPVDPLFLGCNEKDVYDSSDYHAVYNLVAHTEDRSSADLFRRALGAVFLLKCIENSDFFTEGCNSYDLNKEKMYIGGHILRHVQMLPCNAHEVAEFVYKTYSVQMSEPQEIGSAIYATLSLINHSCDPSVVRHSYGNECVVRAIRNISRGDEILDNYGVLYPVMSKPLRLERLLSQYYFTCNCNACYRNWPMYEKIRTECPVLKCKKCKIGRIMIPADNHTTRAMCADCREVTDITPDLLHLSKSEGFYQGSLDKVLSGEEKNEGLPYLVDHLRLIDRLLVRPWKDYNDCQEAIKQCYSTMANCQVLNEPDSDDEELLESEQRRR